MKSSCSCSPFGAFSGILFLLAAQVLLALGVLSNLSFAQNALPAQNASSKEDPSVLLEKGIYLEETAGKLDEAIQFYLKVLQQIQPARSVAAQAQYRLISCYMKKGQKPEAQAALGQLITLYPEQSELIAKARKLIPEKLDLSPIPWTDGEEMRLLIQTVAGQAIGRISWTARKAQLQSRSIWRIESLMNLTYIGTKQTTLVEADAETLAPITGRTTNANGDFKAAYGPDKIQWSVEGKDKQVQQRDVPVARLLFDNEQAIYLIRCFPLADGYSNSFGIFPVQGGTPIECRIDVTGREKVSVAAGEFDTFKLRLRCYLAPGPQAESSPALLDHTLWISADAHRYLVKYDSGGAQLLLDKAGQADALSAGGGGGAAAAKPDPLMAEDARVQGWRLWGQRKLPEAEERFLAATQLDPTNADGWNGLGWAQFNQGKSQNARVSFEKCVELNAKHPAALNGLGWIAKNAGQKDQAIRFWETAVAASPQASAALSGLATTFMESGDYANAAKYYDLWVKAEPNNTDAREGFRRAQEAVLSGQKGAQAPAAPAGAPAVGAPASAPALQGAVVPQSAASSSAAPAANAPANGQPEPAAQGPPRIVSSFPPAGAVDVDPATAEITVTFDQPMSTNSFAWTGGGEIFPKTPPGKKASWRDERTCVLPVQLEAARYYRVGINAGKKFSGFRSAKGVPTETSAIYFTTQGATPEIKQRVQKPRVVSIEPPDGAQNVDPKIKEIRVTFDVQMGGGMSWCGGGENFPQSPEGGRSQWTPDGKTCVMPCILKPNWQYNLGINCYSFKNFSSAWGVPADSMSYDFKTAQ